MCLLAGLAFACLALPFPTRANDAPGYPRLANFYSHGFVDRANLQQLARWDVLILNSVWTQDDLGLLRWYNPDIKLFLYVCPYCIESPPNPRDPWKGAAFEYAQANDLWWYDVQGQIASDWPDTRMINLTDAGFRGPLGSWREFLALYVEDLVRDRPALDGVFFDNYWKRLSWAQAKLQLDSDCNPTFHPTGCNGVADTPAQLDTLWNRALRELARDVRRRFDRLETVRDRPLALLSNGATDYFTYLNGTFYESFPSGGAPDVGNPHRYAWNATMRDAPGGYLVAPFRTVPYRLSIVNASWPGSVEAPDRGPDFERHKRFTLGSALLGDGYYSLDTGILGHGNLWWEPEYDLDGRGKGWLGQPLGPPVALPVLDGPELLANPGFDTGLAPWHVTAGPGPPVASAALDSSVRRTSPFAVRLVRAAHTAATPKLSQHPLPVIAGRPYTIELHAFAPGPVDVGVRLTGSGCPEDLCSPNWSLRTEPGWRAYSVSFVAPVSAATGLDIVLQEPGVVWIDDVSLREGSRDVFRRDFEHGIVLLNVTGQARPIDLGRRFRRPQVTGSAVYDGAVVDTETVPAWDARFLLRLPSEAGFPKPGADAGPAPLGIRPNPMQGRATLRFAVPWGETAAVEVFDVAGRRLRRWTAPGATAAAPGAADSQPERVVQITWDRRDAGGRSVAAGLYFVRVRTGTSTRHAKIVVLDDTSP